MTKKSGRRPYGWGYDDLGLVLRHVIRTVWQVVPGGVIRAGKTDYGEGTGWWLGIDPADGLAKLDLGDGDDYLRWNGSALEIAGDGGGLTNIDGGTIKSGTITAEQIAAGTIVGGKIAAGTITADKLNVSTVSAVSANMGMLTAGEIRMYTGTWDSDATGFRLNSSEIAGQASGADQIVLSSSTGKFTAGGGHVTLDSDGLTFAAGIGTSNKINWGTVGEVYAYTSGATGKAVFYGTAMGTTNGSQGHLAAYNSYSYVLITADADTSDPKFRVAINFTDLLEMDKYGIVDFKGSFGTSTKDPTSDAPADWVEIKIGGTTRFLPAYAA